MFLTGLVSSNSGSCSGVAMGGGSAGGGSAGLTSSARVLVRGGADEATGDVLPARVVAERAGWCAALAREMTAGLLAGHWNPGDVRALASGLDAAGRALPGQAWMALRRLGWGAAPPEGVYVNDRVARMAQEQAGRLLRSAAWRDAVTAGVLATWPQGDPAKRSPAGWDAVRAAVPGGEHVPSPVIRARTRQVRAFEKGHGRLPADVFELEGPPGAGAVVLLLPACDKQEAVIARSAADPGRALLRVKLPSRPDPRSRRDWSWVAVPLALPPTVPPGAVLHLPALRIVKGKLRAEVPFTRPVPAARRAGHQTALGADWGVCTLLSAGAAVLGLDETITALGAGAQYQAGGILAKLRRLRRHSELLQAKIGHCERLPGGNPGHPLAGKTTVLRAEAERVSARRSHLNDALAWSAARWTVDQAIAAGASVIYLEDLRSLEARGMGKTLSTRISQSVRGKIAGRIGYLGAKEGIAVVTVPPRGTSRNCPACLAVLRHRKAPDRPAEAGWKWASCPGCGWQGDRDTGAWMRIAARGLAHQDKTTVDRKAGTMAVRTVDEALEARAVVTPYACAGDRSKSGPTPRRKKKTSRPVPRRRGIPSPARPSGPAGQRPEGRVTT
ncbi:MAG: zinc ribbon domain-containing protein, partial [Trebonia sp.]